MAFQLSLAMLPVSNIAKEADQPGLEVRSIQAPEYVQPVLEHVEQPHYAEPLAIHYPKSDDRGVNSDHGLIETSKRRKHIAMKRSTLSWSVALICIVVIAAVGGGVGGTMAVQDARRNCAPAPVTSNGPVPTENFDGNEGSSMYTLPTPVTAWGPDLTAVPMPQRQDFIYDSTANASARFDVYWAKNLFNHTFASFVATTFELCAEACINTNRIYYTPDSSPDAVVCHAIVWEPVQIGRNGQAGGCYLKTGNFDNNDLVNEPDVAWTALLRR